MNKYNTSQDSDTDHSKIFFFFLWMIFVAEQRFRSTDCHSFWEYVRWRCYTNLVGNVCLSKAMLIYQNLGYFVFSFCLSVRYVDMSIKRVIKSFVTDINKYEFSWTDIFERHFFVDLKFYTTSWPLFGYWKSTLSSIVCKYIFFFFRSTCIILSCCINMQYYSSSRCFFPVSSLFVFTL